MKFIDVIDFINLNDLLQAFSVLLDDWIFLHIEKLVWMQHCSISFIVEVVIYLVLLIYKVLCNLMFMLARVSLMYSIWETVQNIESTLATIK